MRLQVGVGHLHRNLGGQLEAPFFQFGLGGLQALLAEVVVLVEEGDAVLLGGLDQVGHQGLGLHVVLRVQREEVAVALFGPLGGSRGRADPGDLLVQQVVLDRHARAGAHAADEGENVFFFDQLHHRRLGLGGLVGVVADEQLQFTPVDAALFVDHLEVGRGPPGHRAPQRRRTGLRAPLAHGDGVLGDANGGGRLRGCLRRSLSRFFGRLGRGFGLLLLGRAAHHQHGRRQDAQDRHQFPCHVSPSLG